MSNTPEILWAPAPDAWETSRIGRFARHLRDRGLADVSNYDDLWTWSVENPAPFWAAVAEFFDVSFTEPWHEVRSADPMPHTRWFTGSTLNYAAHILRNTGDDIAIRARSDTRAPFDLTYRELHEQVGRARAGLQRLGVEAGDRVVAYAPNIPETIVAFLATASLGAIWASCSPEFGARSVIDRFGQLEPKVLLVVDGYVHRDTAIDRSDNNRAIAQALDTVQKVVTIGYLREDNGPGSWADLTADAAPAVCDPVPFDHPLFVLFSSGTTGLPKAIVHGHGNILVEHYKYHGLHTEIGPGDVMLRPGTTAWMVWNTMVSALLTGCTITTYDGDITYPSIDRIWSMADELGATQVGVGAAYLATCAKVDLDVGAYDLSRLKVISSTGSPLSGDGYDWVYRRVKSDVMLTSGSGGTDVCSMFVGGAAVLPVTKGEIACRALGVAVDSFDADGNSVVNERGELVITAPMPSMPVRFWGDDDGSVYRRSYFDVYPGVWRHGDWITITDRGTAVISGRSDATLNRGGVRLGTGEFYGVLDAMPDLVDSVVVHLEDTGDGRLLLLAVPREGVDGAKLIAALRRDLRAQLSPRHSPDVIYLVPTLPRTMTDKRLEVPVKRILEGAAPDTVLSLDAIRGGEGVMVLSELAAAEHDEDRDLRPLATPLP